ncbi:cysteine hydrolase family protein [Konateibacter massiliensis]|uniref:cysteine hydrolase family protein n=1 Tax=Konateibacter massiliensis TaxID=2002841 RepID=UPI000C15E7C3|nr:isochorismatase family cysteine hydrolase [Konateibacter massiliensis]
MKALLVIDMQEDYVGEGRNKKRFPYNPEILIPRVNQRILDFVDAGNMVIYIVNRFFYQRKIYIPQLVKGINIIEPNTVFVKSRVSCFTNAELSQYLRDKRVTEVEIVGVDGNYCVAASARDGKKNGLAIIFNHSCIGAADADKLEKTLSQLANDGISILE